MTKELKQEFLTNNFITINQSPDGTVRVFQKDMKTDDIRERKVYPATTHHKCGTSLTYLLVNLYDFEKKKWTNLPIQRLVYISFIGDVPAGYDVDHIDSDTFNNLPSNLQILTRKENLAKRKKILENHYLTTPLYCLETGQTFSNTRQASLALNTSIYYITETLKGKFLKKAKYHFIYN